jgi:DNA replication protein DnaC
MSGADVSATNTTAHTADTPQLLLEHHLKELRLPTILREYDKVARQCAVEQVDYQRYLLRMTELELLDRERRATERRIRQAKFPVVKTMDSFDFLAMPSLNKTLVLELARCDFLTRRENLLLLGNSGTGKTHIALALGLAACQRGHRVRFTTTAALVSELIEARDEKKLLRFQKQIASYELLIVDELGFVPLSKTGAELLFEMLSQRYERGSTLITSNLPFLRPRARAMCVLPVPLLPSSRTFSRRARNSHRASSSTRVLFTDGIARKSKLSMVLTTGNFACRIRRSVALRSRSSNSSSVMRSR